MGYGTKQVQRRPAYAAARSVTSEWRQGPKRLPRPTLTPPKTPANAAERRRMRKATVHFLARALGVECRRITTVPLEQVYTLVSDAPPSQRDNARRLLAKLLRLTPDRAAAASTITWAR